MTPPRKGRPCPHCPNVVITGGKSQWDAHANLHTFNNRGARRWRTRKPYWSWAYEMLNPDELGPELWIERTQASKGVPPEYIAHRVHPGAAPETMKLAARSAVQAKAEAEELLHLPQWDAAVARERRGHRIAAVLSAGESSAA
jgi:hypothetical protein